MQKNPLNQIDGNVMAWMADRDPDSPRKCSRCGEWDEDCRCEDEDE